MEGRFFVEGAKCGVSWVGPGVGVVNAEVQYVKDGETKYISLSECEGCPNFYLSDKSIYDSMMEMDDETADYLETLFIEEFEGIALGEYDELEDTLEDYADNPAAALIEYLVAVVRCSNEELDEYIALGTKKYADEIVIPSEEGIDFTDMDQETIFKYRLHLEACIKQPHVYDVLDGSAHKTMNRDLKRTVKLSGEGYENWKEKYLLEKMEEMKAVKLITVPYMFAGTGSFEDVIPESMLDSFKCWINGNGSAFMSEPREATEDEIKIYIAKNVFDE